jgi:hypothetical protein
MELASLLNLCVIKVMKYGVAQYLEVVGSDLVSTVLYLKLIVSFLFFVYLLKFLSNT